MSIVRIAKYIDRERIAFYDNLDKHEILRRLCILSGKKVDNLEIFLDAIYAREKIMSTGIGMFTAFPHVKIPSIPEFFISIGIVRNGIDWDSFDGKPVNIVFLIGGPDGQQIHYLGILSKLSLIVKNGITRNKLLSSESEDDVINVIRKF